MDHINTLFTDGGDTWQGIFDATLGQSGIDVEQPAVDYFTMRAAQRPPRIR